MWSLVAPDPAYEGRVKQCLSTTTTHSEVLACQESPLPTTSAPAAPPSVAFLSPTTPAQQQVLCAHCNKWTPVRNLREPPSHSTAICDDSNTGFKTPTVSRSYDSGKNNNDADLTSLDRKVVSACKATQECLVSPAPVNERRNKVFRLCASTKPLQQSLQNRLRKQLNNDKELCKARATNLGEMAPEGYTPIMVSAHAGNVDAAKIILEIDETASNEVDQHGETALHIAARRGHADVLEVIADHIKARGGGIDTMVDLGGRTPYGAAVTSPVPRAKQNRKRLEAALFSTADVSIFGSPPPTVARQKVFAPLRIAYGHADMPGRRVIMEDSYCAEFWKNEATGQGFCLLGVCDGHGDQGYVSRFVCDGMLALIQEKTMQLVPNDDNQSQTDWSKLWTDACLELDVSLKEKGLSGGSTGVFSLVTQSAIVVANVGDR